MYAQHMKPTELLKHLPPLQQLLPGDLHPETFLSGDYVVVDFETTNIDKGDCNNPNNSIVLTVWYVVRDGDLVAVKSLRGSEFELGELVEDIEQSNFCVAHNAKFEAGWLRRCGLKIEDTLFFCTQIAEYVYLGNRKKSLKLDDVGERRGLGRKESFVSKLIKAGVCPSEIPASFLHKYCVQDVDLTFRVFKQQLADLQEKELLPVMYTRCILSPVLVDIESKGMHLDKRRVIEEHIKHEQEYSRITGELEEFAGGTNLNSPQQVAELLYDRLGFSELTDRRGNALRTSADGRKTDIETITKLKANNKSQRRFIALLKERSRVGAALTKNLHFFRAVVDEREDCIFQGSFNQTVTQTHRLSSSGKSVKFKAFKKAKGIQLQNIPRLFKTLFTARKEGWKIGEADGGQLEFRVAAFLGQDERAIEDIRDGVDVHAFTAQTLTDAGESTSRQDAKSRTFKPLYGGQSGTKAERAYYAAFKEKYSGVADTQEEWKSIVERTKELRTITGLIFYWPDTRWEGSARNPYLKNTTSICNFPVQSFATADIIPIAVVYMWYLMKWFELQSFLISTIHDSVIGEVHPDEEKQFEELATIAFEHCVLFYLDKVYNIDFNVPLETEVKIGDYWNG